MADEKKLILAVAAVIILLAAGLWQLSRIEPSQEKTEASRPWSADQAIPDERILVQFLGMPVQLDHGKESKAAQMFLKATQESPEKYGTIDLDIADDVVKQRMQATAIELANFSNMDLVCESAVNPDLLCEQIDKSYKDIRSAMPAHFIMHPAGAFDCARSRASIDQICDEATIRGQTRILCQGIASKDCRAAYRDAIQDYTYAMMALQTKGSGFCQLIDEPYLRASCQAGDFVAVRSDLERGYD